MFALDPRPDLFRTRLPDDFIEDDILKKYDHFVTRKPHTFCSFIDVMNESIQSFDLPSFGFNANTQESVSALGGSSESVSAPSQNIQKTIDNSFSITFRHTEAYMSYWFMVEHYFKKYQLGPDGNRTPMSFLNLEVLNYRQQSIATISFSNVLYTGADGLSLSYASIDRAATTFTVNFQYQTFTPSFTIPEINAT